MGSQEEVLYKRRFPEDDPEEGRERHSINLSLVILIAVGLGLCCSMIPFVIIFSRQSAENDLTMVDTLPFFDVPKTPAPSVTAPSRTTPSHLTNRSVTFPDQGHHVTPSGLGPNVCTGSLCRFLAVTLRYSIDYTVDPCKDFYKYVCAGFRGETVFRQVENAVEVATRTDFISAHFPASNQLSWQKAAAMYQACMSFTSSYRTETSDLVTWMKTLNLDLLNKDTLATVDPFEMMVRGSLDFGVEALISITFRSRVFWFGKRLMEMDYSRQQDIWQAEKHYVNDYVLFLAGFGATSYHVYDLALKLRGYENHLEDVAKATPAVNHIIDFVDLSRRSAPYISIVDWDTLLRKYTNNIYEKDDVIDYRQDIGTILAKLFGSKHVDKEGLQYLVAWTIYRQLFEFTVPIYFLKDRSASDACYEHVKKVMKVAITSHYFQSVVPRRMVYQTKYMVSRIRNAFDEALQSSSWLTPKLRALASGELINLTVYVGSPGRRLDADYIEELYKPYPDVPLDRLFPTWIKYLSLNTPLAWRDQKTVLYDDTDVNTYYWPHEEGQSCLRRSHKSVLSLSHHDDTLNETTDSENLCDLVGTMVAYAAYSSLPAKYKSAQGLRSNMDQGRHVLYKRQLPEAENEKKNAYRWMNLYLVLMLLVGLGLLGCLFVLGFIPTKQSEYDATTVLNSIHLYTLLRLTVPYIPDSNQLSWQKAAGMYHACLNFVSEYEPETKYLVEWLTSMDLDILNENRLANVNPIKMIVRGSLELGVPALIYISFTQKEFRNKKRIMQLDYLEDDFSLHDFRHEMADYTEFLLRYGAQPPWDTKMAEIIKSYDDHLRLIESSTNLDQDLEPVRVNTLGIHTAPYVTSDDWINYIMLYTNNTYQAADYIYYRKGALHILVKIYKNMGETALRYLVAWKFFLRLVRFTEPYIFLDNRSASDACYEHVTQVMSLAVLSPFFQTEVPPYVVGRVTNMLNEIRDAYVRAVHYSTWLSTDFRQAAKRKIKEMMIYVGSPGQRFDPPYVELLYKPYPDAPLDLEALFPTWIKALGLSSQYMWMDTKTPLYDETGVSPYYEGDINDITVPTASMLRPFMYAHGVHALNYGGLGTMIGQAIMGALDPRGIHSLNGYVPDARDDVMKEYTKRALCLRKSGQSVLYLTRQGGTLSDGLDSENLADLVGTKMAYDAFQYLVGEQRDQNLAGLNMSVQQLFFVSHCAKWCSENNTAEPPLAPPRARCIVPLMNMREFSSAFGCADKAPMNPKEKCTFW
ncbi:hypothetical protein MTO96_031157 [Rhipicephalus appendiculatus]